MPTAVPNPAKLRRSNSGLIDPPPPPLDAAGGTSVAGAMAGTSEPGRSGMVVVGRVDDAVVPWRAVAVVADDGPVVTACGAVVATTVGRGRSVVGGVVGMIWARADPAPI